MNRRAPLAFSAAQHTARAPGESQALRQIHWQTPVDLSPQYSGSSLLVHYGSPLVTAGNTLIVPVKTGETGGFRVEARAATDGSLQWSLPSDYLLPPHDWTLVFGPADDEVQQLLRSSVRRRSGDGGSWGRLVTCPGHVGKLPHVSI